MKWNLEQLELLARLIRLVDRFREVYGVDPIKDAQILARISSLEELEKELEDPGNRFMMTRFIESGGSAGHSAHSFYRVTMIARLLKEVFE